MDGRKSQLAPVTQVLRLMNEGQQEKLEGEVIVGMAPYRMRVKWLKDFKYLTITLQEVESGMSPTLKPLVNTFTESLSRELTTRLGDLRGAQTLSLLDSRIREVIIENLESQVVRPVKLRLRELQVYC
jgi:hypothetical protein